MKYWLPDELKTFLTTLENDINYSNNRLVKEKAYLIKILTITNFSLGDRIGETRALTFNCINKENKTIIIKHSINYDTKSTNYFSTTKTPKSQRINEITDKLIQEIEDYKNFLINECNYKVNDDSLIIFNYKNNKPYSDATLRKHFKYYCNKANVKIIRMYDLRHTYVATMMAEGKPLYYISPKIGHNNYITTVKKYGHISDEVKRKLAESTDKYI